MCIELVRKVVEIRDEIALMDDGRSVRISMVTDVHIGDSLEVYGDIALSKIIDSTRVTNASTTNT